MTASSHGSEVTGSPADEPTEWEKRRRSMERKTVMDTLESLGFDVDNLVDLQKDMAFSRRLRIASENANAKIVAGIIGLVFTVIGALGTLFIQSLGPK